MSPAFAECYENQEEWDSFLSQAQIEIFGSERSTLHPMNSAFKLYLEQLEFVKNCEDDEDEDDVEPCDRCPCKDISWCMSSGCMSEDEEEDDRVECSECEYEMSKYAFDAGKGRLMFDDLEDGKFRCGVCDDRVDDPQGRFPNDTDDEEDDFCGLRGAQAAQARADVNYNSQFEMSSEEYDKIKGEDVVQHFDVCGHEECDTLIPEYLDEETGDLMDGCEEYCSDTCREAQSIVEQKYEEEQKNSNLKFV